MSHQHTYTAHDADSITWWSWRPGIQPRKAIFLGGLITLLALLLGSIGLVTLVLGIMDSFSAPFQLQGIVSSHIVNNLDDFPRLSIRLHTVGFPATISPTVSKATFHAIHNVPFWILTPFTGWKERKRSADRNSPQRIRTYWCVFNHGNIVLVL